jgi:hypothetical protein
VKVFLNNRATKEHQLIKKEDQERPRQPEGEDGRASPVWGFVVMKEEGKLENHENKDEVLEGFNSNRTYILV